MELCGKLTPDDKLYWHLINEFEMWFKMSPHMPHVLNGPKSLSAQPNPDPIQRLARKGFGTVQAMWHVGAHFKALIISRGAPPSNFSLTGIFYLEIFVALCGRRGLGTSKYYIRGVELYVLMVAGWTDPTDQGLLLEQ